jgi:DNA-binding MarR family transcriptional regulator
MTVNHFTRYRMAGELAVPASGKLTYLVLLDVIDDKNEVIIPQRKISEALGMGRQTVSRSLRRLRVGGHIAIEPTYNECGGRMPNRYRVL